METGQDGSISVSLEDFAGEAFGDFTPADATPGSSDTGSAAVTTAEHPPETPESPDGPEGATAAERTGTPPSAAATPAPDAGDPPPDDPFATASPATYTVDGQARTYEGIKVLGEDFGGRAIIEPTDLPDVMRRLGERDHLVAANQVAYRERQALEPLTAWTVTGDDGKEQTLTGQHGLTAMHVDYAKMQAAVQVVDGLLADPTKILALLAQDAEGKISVDPAALETLQLRIVNAANAVERQTRAKLGAIVTEATKPQAPTVNFEEKGPAFIKGLAGADSGLLTPADMKFLSAQLPRYHVKGTTTIDPQFSDVVQDRIAQRRELAKVGTTVTDAAKENSARLAAAARGVKPIAKAPVAKPATAQQQHETSRVSDADAGYELLSNLTSRRVAR